MQRLVNLLPDTEVGGGHGDVAVIQGNADEAEK